MKQYAAVFLLTLCVMFTGCASAQMGEFTADDVQISAMGAIGRVETLSGPLFEGDGGADIRLAVFAPETQGSVPDYLPLYVQGLLSNNFNKYSRVTLIDRQNLNTIIAEQNIAASGRFSEKDYVSIGQLTNTQYFMLGTIQKLSGERYSLQLSITDSATGVRRANFMKDGPLSQIEGSGALINEATADLLGQMGIKLTEAGRQSLLAGNRAVVQAQTGLARGITAQAAGSQIEALFNFTQSIAFDPSQMEALSRLTLLSSTISEGSISERIVNDIQARDRWLEVFKETAVFFNNHPPFEITFDPNLVQEGEINYAKRSANLGMRISLDPSEAGFGALNALLEGLEKTGRRSNWGFSGWPLLDINPKTAGAVVFNGKKSFSFKVDVSLLNDKNKVIGKTAFTLKTGNINFSGGDKKVLAPDGDLGLIRFDNIKADDLTPVLTIVITAVNGIASAKLNSSGYMKIDAGDLEGRVAVSSSSQSAIPEGFVRINGGTFTMGSPANEPSRDSGEIQRQVTVSSFYMGRYEVTQKEYQEVMGNNPSSFKGDNLPVENVTWFDAVEYCNKRSGREGLTAAYTISGSGDNRTVTWNRNAIGYRLPTEAEWEYACRAGTTTPFSTGNNITTGQANYDGNGPYNNNAKGTYWDETTAVGTFAANQWGLHDMHGNVYEWCWDWYGDYTRGAQTDPGGAVSGSDRVLRGGSWCDGAQFLRSADRCDSEPDGWGCNVGFRVVRP